MDEEGIVRVRDAAGTAVMYDAALEDLEATTDEALQIGSLFIQARAPPPPPSRTDWTHLVPPSVLTGRVSLHR